MRTLKIVLAILIVVGFVLAVRLLPVATWLDQFIGYVRGVGPIGYVLYVIAYVVCCVLLIPALALTLGAGAIFGFAKGIIIVQIGATLGATAAFLLGRTVFRRYVEARIVSNPKMAAVDRAIAREGTKIMVLMRLSGFPPFTWINYALGLTAVGVVPYLLTTFFGIIPGTMAFTYAGAAGAEALTGRGNRIALIVTAIGGVLVIAYIARIAANAIRRAGIEQ
ncbi:MAG TPA: VTT domain-containing protein [Thermoanaerobaculia bacterium]|nr:VTT domain-containing protein [Thermoanaerobaculia bacterium]